MSESNDAPLRTSRLGARLAANEPVITELMRHALSRPDILSLAAGFTDNRVLPVELVEFSVQRLGRSFSSREHLQYGMNQGRPGLREEIIKLLASYPGEEGLDLSPDQVLITNGSQQALYMCAQLLCDPGDTVLVEPPSYFVFLELLRGMGLRPRSLPMTEEGRLDVGRLAQRFDVWNRTGELGRIKMLYFMGTYANPSSRSWHEKDKQALGDFLRDAAISLPVIEDMAYRDLYFENGHPARSVLSLPEWNDLPALYAGTFTKAFSSGMKIGYVASRHSDWIERLARLKGHQDFGSSNFCQAILENVLSQGEYQRHLSAIRPTYQRKMQVLDEALRGEGLEELGWSWERPEGGLLLWITAPETIDTSRGAPLFEACLDEGVFYVPGDLCFAEGTPTHSVRLSYGVLDASGLKEAARRFVSAVKRVGAEGGGQASA